MIRLDNAEASFILSDWHLDTTVAVSESASRSRSTCDDQSVNFYVAKKRVTPEKIVCIRQ